MARLPLFFILIYSLHAFSDCLPAPDHSFKLTIYTCQSATFSIDLSKDYDWYTFKENEKIQSGTLLTGAVSENLYDWRGMQNNSSAWADGQLKTVFIDENPDEFCKSSKEKQLRFSEVQLCCDTMPAVGLCLVPVPVVRR